MKGGHKIGLKFIKMNSEGKWGHPNYRNGERIFTASSRVIKDVIKKIYGSDAAY
jgi:hypothetical protein